MANENIGSCDCPICKKEAHVRETKKTKAYIVCDDCGFQGFARGFTANQLLRSNMRNVIKPDEFLPVITVKPATVAQPAAVVTVKPLVTAEKRIIQTPPTAKELTIFDKDFWKGADHAARE